MTPTSMPCPEQGCAKESGHAGYHWNFDRGRWGVNRRRARPPVPELPKPALAPTGHVYCLHNPHTGLLKIGYTKELKSRISSLILACGSPLAVVGTMPGSRTYERAMLRAFDAHRQLGEWFADVAEIRDVFLARATEDEFRVHRSQTTRERLAAFRATSTEP